MKHRFVLFSTAIILAGGAAGADTRSVDTTKEMPAPPNEVLQAFLDGADLKAWWKVSRSLVEPKAGGIWSIAWDDYGEEKTHHAWIGVIEEISADRLFVGHLVMIEPDMPLLGPMQLEISVAADGAGSALTVSHRGYRYGEHWDEMYRIVVQGWDHVLGDMREWLTEAH